MGDSDTHVGYAELDFASAYEKIGWNFERL